MKIFRMASGQLEIGTCGSHALAKIHVVEREDLRDLNNGTVDWRFLGLVRVSYTSQIFTQYPTQESEKHNR